MSNWNYNFRNFRVETTRGDRGGFQVCDLYDSDFTPDQDHQHGNLIAAAPDMLKALEYIVNHCRVICDDSFDTIDGMATEDAIRAIRKAKGEA